MSANVSQPRHGKAGADADLRRVAQVRGAWTVDRVSVAFLAALLPALTVAYLGGTGGELARMFAITLAITYAWQILFGVVRGTPVGWDGAVTALTMSLMLPLSASLWQAALAVTVGVVLGELIFGGRGRSFLNPAAVGLAFFSFSFPATMALSPASLDAWPVLLGAGILLLFRIVSWRVLIGGYAGMLLATWIAGSIGPESFLSAPLAFGMVFLAADPVSAAATNPARWGYGILIGVLFVLFGADAVAVIFAVLLASVFAPLLDQGAVWIMRRRRRRAPWLF